MATKLIWYEVVDLTSYALKYPKDWYYRCGGDYHAKEYSVYESLGKYSSEEKAIQRLKKWAESKGLNEELMTKIDDEEPIYYEDNLDVDCIPIYDLGIWYDVHDNETKSRMDRSYGTAAMIVRKEMELDMD